MSSMSADEMIDRYRFCMSLRKKKVGETAIYYNPAAKDFALINKEEMTSKMMNFRKLRKAGVLTIAEENNNEITLKDHPDAKLNGKVWYSLVVQHAEPENDSFDYYAMFILGVMVDGLVFTFDKKENRDAVYKYIMGIKQ